MIFMPMRKNDRGDVVAKLFEDFKIGNANVDAVDALFGKAHARVENEHLVAIAHQRAVHPELADAAEGNNFKDVSHYLLCARLSGGLVSEYSMTITAWALWHGR